MKSTGKCLGLMLVFFTLLGSGKLLAQSFTNSNLNFTQGGVSKGTSLMFGPDGRLYVLNLDGTIDIFDIQKNGPNDYEAIAHEELSFVKDIPNHDDDGSSNNGNSREATGITVVGTPTNPVIYATSSDARVGGPSGDKNLDTNSGVITRLTWNGVSWDVVDIVRGLPRSEENHATNGLEFATIGGTDYLIVCSGGHANAGAPSDNFAWTTEYALSAAVLYVNLSMLEGMSIQNDGQRNYIYDIPTLDDPDRANVNGITDPDDFGYDGIDINDPWGGNDGLNQAMVVAGGPVGIFSGGYRNTYDLTLTQSGAVFVTDNGANGGWGGLPVNEGTDSVNNDYDPAEPGSSSSINGEKVNNKDHLTAVTMDIQNYAFGSFYGGHPTPVRANPEGAGLFTNPEANNYNPATSLFRTQVYDPDGSTPGSTTDPTIGLPANWPPVPVALADPREGDWRGPGINNPDGPNDVLVTTWGTNTNGIDEYTATLIVDTIGMKGSLIAGKNGGVLRRVQVDANGNLVELTNTFASNLGGNCLGITCNGDNDPFAGTIWVAPFNNSIVILEPSVIASCPLPGDQDYLATDDNDLDGYTNQDEIDNKLPGQTDADVICNGGLQPNDFDKAAGGTLVSDLNDNDDDADGILDADDPFQLGDPTDNGSDAFDLPVLNELESDNPVLKGYLGLGFTGLMNNGNTGNNWLDWLDRRDDPNDPNPNDLLGGAVGAMTMQMTSGTAFGGANSQEKGFQYGVNVDASTGAFTVHARMFNFTDPLQLYGSQAPTNGEQGIFIGDGTQSNFMGFILKPTGITAQQEINDGLQNTLNNSISVANRPTNSVEMFIEVNPATGLVTFEYQLDQGSRVNLGSITAQGNIFTAIQDANTPLAVGLIGSSNDPSKELEASWDFLNVAGTQPFVVSQIPTQDKLVGDPSDDIDLDNSFGDDGGTANLTYTVQANSNSDIGAVISGNTLTLTYPSATAASSDITIRATDQQGNFIDQTFTVNVSDEPVPLIRIRANGAPITATDAPNPDWIGGLGVNAQSGTFNGISYSVNTGNASTHNISGRDASVPTYVPQAIFTSERWDPAGTAPDMEWTFGNLPNGNYLVRLYMGNGFNGTSGVGQRVFDISIEGLLVQNDLDLSATLGHQVGGMFEYPVNLTDGTINILFEAVVENPTVNGLEILAIGGSFTPPINITQLSTQNNSQGDVLALPVVATGGDGILSYSATGLPPGLQIEPSTGLIFDTVAVGAASGSPYNVEVTVTDAANNSETMSFVWNIAAGVTPSSALVEVIPGEGNINASTFGGASFQITNNAPTANITKVSYDMSTGFLPNMVFDPQGTAGDLTAKDFQINQGVGGTTTNAFTQPLGNGGFQGLEVTFTDFAPGETFTFSVDQDPTSVEGLGAPGPNESGSVSGLEQVGTTIIVEFSDGSTYTTNLYSDGSNAGATSVAKAGLIAAPVISISGLNSPDISNTASQTLEITGGPANGTVSLLQVEAGFFEGANNLNQEPFEVNSVISVDRSTAIQLDGSGNASVAVTLLDTDAEAGYNYFIAAVEDGGDFGLTSNTLIVEYDDQYVPPVANNILYRVNTGGALEPAADANNPDWDGDTGNFGAAGNSPYLSTLPTGTSTYNQNKGSAYKGPVVMTDPSLPAGTPASLFTTERYDPGAAAPTMTWEFPVPAGTQIELRLYFAELFSVIKAAGERVFDVSIEGSVPSVYDDIDAFARNGALGAFMLSHTLTMTDDTLNLEFINGVENPAIKAIEILGVTTTTPNSAPVVSNPGPQFNVEGDNVSLQVTASDADACSGLTYSATGLPPSLAIDSNTGLISGNLDQGTGGVGGAFIEQNGLVVIEMESADQPLPGSWETSSTYSTTTSPNVNNPGGATGGDFIIWQAGQNLGNPGQGLLTYQVQINNPGTYQFKWRNQVGLGTNTTEHNDTWLKIEADQFFGSKNGGASIVCPNGAPSGTCTATTGLNGSSSGGWFKVYSSGASNWSWVSNTSDNDAHQVFATFDNPGIYNILVSARSSSHAIDRMVLVNQSLAGNNGQSTSLPESPRTTGGTAAASDNSPYNVSVTVADGCTPSLSTVVDFVWTVNDSLATGANPAALVQVNSGAGLNASTFNNNSFLISNTGDVDISSISIDASTGFLMDVVFDPVGTAGDNGAKCLTTGSAGNTAAQVGLTVPGDGGTDQADCESVFTDPHNGVDNDEGYDGMALSFTDFNAGESYAFGVDMDPTSIKGDLSTGDAGSISGFELIGARVTITFADGSTFTSSLFDEGSLGGSDVIIDSLIPAPAPSISVAGSQSKAKVGDLSQTVDITGNPNASVTLLQVDGRLYIDPGQPTVGYDVDPFEANEAMAKVLYTATLDASGNASIPVTLLTTAGAAGTPNGGINHFIAVENGVGGRNSLVSNLIVLEYDSTVTNDASLTLTADLQGRLDNSASFEVNVYSTTDSSTPVYTFNTSSDAAGTMTLTGMAPGTYEVAVKASNYLQVVQTLTLTAGSNAANMGTMAAGDANGDNLISSLDFSILAGSFNLGSGAPGFQAGADFNGDGNVSSLDFSLLAGNFNTAGQEPGN